MRVTIYTLGKLKSAPTKELVEYYLHLCGRSRNPEFVMQVLPDRSSQSPTDALALIEDNQLNRRNTLLLAEWGELIDTARFNKLIGSSQLLGEDLNFIIGNAFGWDSKSRQNSQLRFVSLSPLVFTHELAAVMLLEQCFRYLDKLRGGNFTK